MSAASVRSERQRPESTGGNPGQVVAVPVGPPGDQGDGRPSRRTRIRLTRRGRAVLLGFGLLWGVLLVGLLVGLLAPSSQAAAPDRAAGEAGAPVAVVRPGDTLWSVAARHVPSPDAYGVIQEIRDLNGLVGHTLYPGQRLLLPTR